MRATLVAACLLVLGAGTAQAQDRYPNRTVRIVVPSSPGGVTDILARVIGNGLSQVWGQPVVIDNRPGADGQLGLDTVAKSPGDGYTLLVSSDASFTAGPHLHKEQRYDTRKDFTPIMALGDITPVLNVPASLPVYSVTDLIALAKSKPGQLNYASFGNGTYAHLSFEDLKQRTGMNIMHVAYKGSTPAITALLRGEVSTLIVNMSNVADHVKAGTIRIIAAAGEKRPVSRPDLPTIAESGVPGFSTGAWWGLFAPANLPREVTDKIRESVAGVLATPEAKRLYETNTIEAVDKTPDEFAGLIRRDYDHWGALIKSVSVKIE
ncbi:MAG: tripartite tricarboxylate transporter substrate binding protein [Pseudomonadota bacterium]